MKLSYVSLLPFGSAVRLTDSPESFQQKVSKFLDQFDTGYQEYNNQLQNWVWYANTDVSESNSLKQDEAYTLLAKFRREQFPIAQNFLNQAYHDFETQVLSNNQMRQLKKIMELDTMALPEEDYEEFVKIVINMEAIYSEAEVEINGEKLPLSPDLNNILQTSTDFELLTQVWEGYRAETGQKYKDQYLKNIQYMNQAANLNLFDNEGDLWKSWYEEDYFEEALEIIWQEIQPLYQQLHAYVRGKLMEIYPEHIQAKGPIPANVLGNMWAQSWENIYNLVEPFPGYINPDPGPGMKANNWTADILLHESDKFFTSLGLIPMNEPFWATSKFEKPDPPQVMHCGGQAFDFRNASSYAIKMCTVLDSKNFLTAHHEMGHIEYYMQYRVAPRIIPLSIFREEVDLCNADF